MQLTKSQINALRALQSDARWSTIEYFVNEYIKENFTQQTIKRDSDFNTLWEAAYAEGGKFHIQKLFNQMEQTVINSLE